MTKVTAIEVAPTSTSKPANGEILISLVLDETGSMNSCCDATIGSVNEYLGTQKNQDGVARVNLYKFSDIGWGGYGRGTVSATNAHNIQPNFRTVFESNLVADVPELTRQNYTPDGMTNLYDAIGKGIRSVERQLAPLNEVPDVLFVIVTDGGENSSKEFSLEAVRDLIQAKETEGWTFVYLGANQDAWKVGSQFGLAKGQTMTYSTNDMKGTMNTLSAATSVYRSSRMTGDVAYGSVTKEFFAPEDGDKNA
jgi:hypothetical protein